MGIWTKRKLLEVFSRVGFKPQKSLGQNFLIDPNFLNFIVQSANISSSDRILEIGAGAGVLTKLLAQKAKEVIAFEIDKNIFQIAKSNLADCNNVKLFNEDAIEAIGRLKRSRVKVVSNLPYANYAKILLWLFSSRMNITELFILVQFEVYKKLFAVPNYDEYSAIGAITQALYDIKLIRTVSPEAFYPKPKVKSAFINLVPKSQPIISKDEVKSIYSTLKTLLPQRRKKIKLLNKRISELENKEIIDLTRKLI